MKFECPKCKGTGVIQATDVDYDPCRRCNGTGFIQAPFDMTLQEQLEKAQNYLAQYRATVTPINSEITQWFEAVIESLARLIDLER